MCDNTDRDRATAFHEAGHIVALAHVGIKTRNVYLYEDGNGLTDPDSDPTTEDDIVLVALAGLQSEALADQRLGADISLNMYFGAQVDRDNFEKTARRVWLGHGSNSIWYEIQHNRVKKFVQDHWGVIIAIASEILAVPNYPKCLIRVELNNLLKQSQSSG